MGSCRKTKDQRFYVWEGQVGGEQRGAGGREKHLEDISSCHDQTVPNYSPPLPPPHAPSTVPCYNLAQQDHKEKIKLKQANYWAIY